MSSLSASPSPQAELPDLDHLTMDDFRHIYEPSDDTFLLMDALEADARDLKARKPRIVVEIG
jgi:release factor glutamine methyltransferase